MILEVYGLILDNDILVLIDKVGDPYNSKLDLSEYTIEFGKTREQILVRKV